MVGRDESYYYVYSCDLNQRVKIRIGSLEGNVPEKDFEELLNDPIAPFRREQLVLVSAEVYCNGTSVALPVNTTPIPVGGKFNRHIIKWDEWLVLPVQYCELSRDVVVCIRLLDFATEECLGSSVFELFTEDGEFRRGKRDICIWPRVEPDPVYYDSQTSAIGQVDSTHQMPRLKPLEEKWADQQIPRIDWLDRLVFREIEQINHKEKSTGDFLHLMIETQSFYHQSERTNELTSYACVYLERGADKEVKVMTNYHIHKVADFGGKENLVEDAQLRMARSIGRSISETKKPTPSERDKLKEIIQVGLKVDDMENGTLIFRFRHYLCSDPQALIPFLTAVRWTEIDEKRVALEVLQDWAPISAPLALGLLGSDGPCKEVEVRKYAIERLTRADNADLEMFLLQLVQALKYENIQENENNVQTQMAMLQESMQNIDMSQVEAPEQMEQSLYGANEGLSDFLLSASLRDRSLCSFLYWYIKVEQEYSDISGESDYKHVYKYNYRGFLSRFNKNLMINKAIKLRGDLIRQECVIRELVEALKSCQKYSSRPDRLEAFRTLLEDETVRDFGTFTDIKPTMFMLDPRKTIVGINVEKTYMFKSALMPALLHFKMENGEEFPAILKVGDDLRQDQLVLQMISLMNRLLLEEKLDLRLTPYNALATSVDAGLLEFVPNSMGVGDILRKFSTIGKYLHDQCVGNLVHIMENYVRSCAGYCVITYILGIGDRHNDNLLITTEGKLFHIDFGFILGRDPKPMPPPLKLNREMVEAMGIEGWSQFKSYCYEAYINLRRHSQLILSLFALMLNAGIPDIAIEPDKTLQKLREKLKLDLDDEEAVKHMQSIIDQSVSSFMARVSENIHSIAQWAKS